MLLKFFTRFSLKSSLVLALLLVGVLPLLCFIAINLPSVAAKVDQLARLEGVHALEEEVALLAKTIEHRRADLRTITALPGVADLFSDPAESRLPFRAIKQRIGLMFQRWQAPGSGVEKVVMFDAAATLVGLWPLNGTAAAQPAAEAVPAAAVVAEWLAESRLVPLDQVFVADVKQEFLDQEQRHTHFPKVTLGIPGKNKKGEYGGAVFMELSLAPFVDTVPYDFIITGGGRVLHRFEAQHNHGGKVGHVHDNGLEAAEYADLLRVDTDKAYLVLPSPKGGKVVFVKIIDDFHREHTVWLAHAMPSGKLAGWFDKILLRFGLIFILLVVFVLALALTFAQKTERMRRQLVDGLTRLVRQQQPLALGWSWPAEVKELGRDLEVLARSLIESEENLRRNERFLRSILNGIQDGISVHDSSFTILQTNRCMEEWYKEKLPLVGKKCHEVYYDRQIPCDLCPSREAMNSGVLHRGELQGRDQHGRERWLEVFAYPMFDEEGHVSHVVEFLRDVTTRKQTEAERDSLADQLTFSQKMEAVGTLAGGVAHDFNNILSAINGYAEMCLLKMEQDNPFRSKIATILESGKRAARLTQQLLAFSRKQIIHPQEIDVAQSLQGIRKMLARILGEDIDINIVIGRNLWHVHADQTQFEQVIINLAVNARDAMPRGGKLTFDAKNVTLDQDYVEKHYKIEGGDYVLLAISDNGQGMDRQTMAKIFEPFFTTKGKDKGTGLGLATVYGIVKQNNGHILVYSEPGQGTTFKIYLPRLVDAGLPSTPPSAKEEMATGSETILLVEDDEVVRTMTVEILTSLGYSVLEAVDGEDALLTCKRYHGRIELLLTDVVMPRMNGADLAMKVLKLRPDIKVLFMSGYTDDAVVRHGILKDHVAFLQKPVTPNLLAQALRTILDDNDPA